MVEFHVLTLLRQCKMVTTSQVARLFKGYKDPLRAAQRLLKEMADDNMVETREGRTGKKALGAHLYRLTKKGRVQTGGDFHPVPFDTIKVHHWLGLGDIYLDMVEEEPPKIFQTEIRETFFYGGRKYNFSPDIFAVWKKRAMFIEYQRSPLSKQNWRLKWQPIVYYYHSGAYQKGKWQPQHMTVKPRIVAVTSQSTEQVTVWHEYPIEVVENIREVII